MIDFHQPQNQLFWFPLAIFLWLFETETTWQLPKNNLRQNLTERDFEVLTQTLYAGESLEVIQAQKSNYLL